MGGGMPNSPRGHDIRMIDGSPSGIQSRGNAIKRLGDTMQDAADTLRSIKENTFASGQLAGEAIEKLQEVIGDSYKTLEEAADLYKPVGPVIVKYGEMLETSKNNLDTSASTCDDLWATYSALPGDKDGSTEPEAASGGSEEDNAAAEKDAGENQAKKEAYDSWEAEAERFDTWYDVWEDGYEEAVSGITDGLSDSIEDGFWDDIGPAVDFLKKVVDIAAIIVAVVALIAGGWVLALAAAILALAALLLTFAQYKRGAASLSDVIWAGVGIVPFGKISTLAKFGALTKIAGNADEFAKAKTALKGDVFKTFNDLRPSKLKEMAEGPFKFKSFGEMKMLGFKDKGDILQGYKDTLGREFAKGDFNSVKNIARIEQLGGGAGNALSHYGRYQSVSANYDGNILPDVPEVPKVPGINMPVDAVVG